MTAPGCTPALTGAPAAAPVPAACPARTTCEARFDAMRTRLEKGEMELVRLDGETRHLLRSLSAVTKALWAAALSSFGVLLGFFVWYVQQGLHT